MGKLISNTFRIRYFSIWNNLRVYLNFCKLLKTCFEQVPTNCRNNPCTRIYSKCILIIHISISLEMNKVYVKQDGKLNYLKTTILFLLSYNRFKCWWFLLNKLFFVFVLVVEFKSRAVDITFIFCITSL